MDILALLGKKWPKSKFVNARLASRRKCQAYNGRVIVQCFWSKFDQISKCQNLQKGKNCKISKLAEGQKLQKWEDCPKYQAMQDTSRHVKTRQGTWRQDLVDEWTTTRWRMVHSGQSELNRYPSNDRAVTRFGLSLVDGSDMYTITLETSRPSEARE